MTIPSIKNSIDVSVSAGIIFVGILIIAVCLMPILLTQNHNLWWEVIIHLEILPYYIILVYLLLVIGFVFVIGGILAFIGHDPKLDS